MENASSRFLDNPGPYLVAIVLVLFAMLFGLMQTDFATYGRVNASMSSALGVKYTDTFQKLRATTAEYDCGGGGGSSLYSGCTAKVTDSDGTTYRIDTNDDAWKQFDFYWSFNFKATLTQTPHGPVFQVRESSNHDKQSFTDVANQISDTLNRMLGLYAADSARQHAVDASWRHR